MITKEKYNEAVKKYPVKGVAEWYLKYFFAHKAEKYYAAIMLLAMLGGFFGTVFGLGRSFIGFSTYLFLSLMIPLAFVHIVSWYGLKSVYKKRSKYLGISLIEYYIYTNQFVAKENK